MFNQKKTRFDCNDNGQQTNGQWLHKPEQILIILHILLVTYCTNIEWHSSFYKHVNLKVM